MCIFLFLDQTFYASSMHSPASVVAGPGPMNGWTPSGEVSHISRTNPTVCNMIAPSAASAWSPAYTATVASASSSSGASNSPVKQPSSLQTSVIQTAGKIQHSGGLIVTNIDNDKPEDSNEHALIKRNKSESPHDQHGVNGASYYSKSQCLFFILKCQHLIRLKKNRL